MKNTAFLWVLVLLSFATILQAEKPMFAKDPSISPDGKQVCFVYDDDLWIVDFDGGDARRLTSTQASEWGPQWSYDGKWIAFNANRGGITHPYLISAQGGEAKAIIKEGYTVVEWFKDSDALLVTKYLLRYGTAFYKLPLDGSRPTLLAEIGDRFATLSPDNNSIIFNRYGDAYREAYTGSLSGNLWKIDLQSKEYSQLTDGEYSYRYPRFSHSSGALFFCQSDGKSFQLKRSQNLDFDAAEQLSFLSPWSVRDLSVAKDNERVVFEHFDEIYRYDPSAAQGSRVSRLDINIPEDMWQDTSRFENARNDISLVAVSDNDKMIAYEYKYDAFLRPKKGGESKRITFDQGGISNLIFSEDGRSLYIQKRAQGKQKIFRTSVENPTNLQEFEWFGSDSLWVEDFYRESKDKWILMYSGAVMSSQVAIADSGLTNLRPINAPWPVISNFALNDSQDYAAYISIRPDFVYELYIYDFATQKHIKLMNLESGGASILWSQDDRSLLLGLRGEIYRLDLVPRDEFEYDEDYWALALQQDDIEPEMPETLELQLDEPGEEDIEASIEEAIEPSRAELEIYWPGLKQRLVSIIKESEAYLSVKDWQTDQRFYYYSNGSFYNKNLLLKSVTIYGKESKTELDFGFKPQDISQQDKGFHYLLNGVINSCDIGGNPKEIMVDTDYEWDVSVLNTRVFEEVWGVFGDNFYDPLMHGNDWQAMYQQYLPYAQKARNMDDLANVVNEMIGDLNASHTGFYPRRETQQRYHQMAYLGLDFDTKQPLDEGLKISFVYPHTRLDHYFKLKEGDLLTHIDGVKITSKISLDSLLLDKVNKRIYLKLRRGDQEIEADIKGLSFADLRKLAYAHKIDQRRKMVDELSNSQVGYIHIPAMGTEDYNKFIQELYTDNLDKKALVIDFRGNVGGRIHDLIINVLLKKQYAFSTSRSRTYQRMPEPYGAWDRPSIVLVDENSFSDGEIFPTVYKQLKLGKVVGYPSSGAVIGTREYKLVDGSAMRMPGSGWYKMDGTNMEGTGAMPDIIIQNTPNDIIADRDPQLLRAIEEILKEI